MVRHIHDFNGKRVTVDVDASRILVDLGDAALWKDVGGVEPRKSTTQDNRRIDEQTDHGIDHEYTRSKAAPSTDGHSLVPVTTNPTSLACIPVKWSKHQAGQETIPRR